MNALHIFGIALLIGATLPLDLRLLGARRSVPRKVLVRVLAPVAAGGLCIAVLAGLWLFSIRAREYAGIGFPQTKLTLVAIGTVSALALRWSHGLLLKTANWPRLAIHAVVSLICWIGALVCGRLIAFAGE